MHEGSNKLDLHCPLWVRESLPGEVVHSRPSRRPSAPFPACHNVPFNMDSRRERSLRGPQQRPHWHVDGVREGGGPGLQPAELKVLRWWQGCGRGDTWLLINGGALEGQGSSTVEKCACACCMLGVQEAGPVRGGGTASKGFRREGQKASYSACLFSFSYCWS